MTIELKVPSFGESVTEAYLGDWLKAEGEHVEQDEPLVVLETDKVTAELPAPAAGTITKVLKQKGDTASVGETIGMMSEGESQGTAPAAEEAETTDVPAKAATPPPAPRAPAAEDVRVMPAARRELAERGFDAKDVTPSGPGGRLLKEDVARHAAQPAATAPTGGARDVERVPMTRLRQRIAERLVEAQQTAALLTTFNECDMTNVKTLRADYKEAFQEKYGIKLGFMSFFVRAAIDALKLIPQVNATIDGTDIVYHNYYDIGIAVGGGRGLVVPVLRNAERMSFADIETGISDFAARAKANTLTVDELQGGTFTISNGGVYGSMMSTPIINSPQSGILGLHAIQDRPVAIDGQLEVRPMMYVALTYDHRIIDGRESVTFLKRIKECIENPARMLLET